MSKAKVVTDKDLARTEHSLILSAMQLGYKCCEQGISLKEAEANLREIFREIAEEDVKAFKGGKRGLHHPVSKHH